MAPQLVSGAFDSTLSLELKATKATCSAKLTLLLECGCTSRGYKNRLRFIFQYQLFLSQPLYTRLWLAGLRVSLCRHEQHVPHDMCTDLYCLWCHYIPSSIPGFLVNEPRRRLLPLHVPVRDLSGDLFVDSKIDVARKHQ